MLKTTNHEITFSEIPDEITLCINISNCCIRCPDCHSKFLWEDVGEELTENLVFSLIDKNEGISCICFMGGDSDSAYLAKLLSKVKEKYPKLKTAIYSGKEYLDKTFNLSDLDFVKIGPYKKELGGLNNPKTNQRFYSLHPTLKDITHKFWKNDNNTNIINSNQYC